MKKDIKRWKGIARKLIRKQNNKSRGRTLGLHSKLHCLAGDCHSLLEGGEKCSSQVQWEGMKDSKRKGWQLWNNDRVCVQGSSGKHQFSYCCEFISLSPVDRKREIERWRSLPIIRAVHHTGCCVHRGN